MSFAPLVGNQAAIAAAKREFGGARVTIVVGSPASGRTTFVRCLEAHFRATLRFEFVDLDDGDLRATLRAKCCRRAGVLEAFAAQREYVDDRRGSRIVLDNVDASERNLVAIIEGTVAECPRAVGVVLVTDWPGLRKLSGLKKKGALTLQLSAPCKDAVQRWAFRTLLTDPGDDGAIARLRAMLRACRHSIHGLKRAYDLGLTPAQAAEDASAPGSHDNSSTLVKLFAGPLSFESLYGAVAHDGGSMLGQLAWHNAPSLIDEDRYVAVLAASMAGMEIERAAHLTHEFGACALGHALSLAPYAGVAPGADRAGMAYTTTMAQGGARAVARRALTSACDDRSVSERAWDACLSVPARARRPAGAKISPGTSADAKMSPADPPCAKISPGTSAGAKMSPRTSAGEMSPATGKEMSSLARLHAYLAQPRVMTAVVGGSLLCLTIVAVLVIRRVLQTSLVVQPVFNDLASGNGDRVVVKGSSIPDLANGLEFGYSFWLYLQPGPGAVSDRLVFAHPVDGNGCKVYLDRDSNAVRFAVSGASDAPAVKYVPMSRWVHLVAVCANGTLTWFVDGEVHSVHALDVPLTFSGPTGSLTICGGANTVGMSPFQGYCGYVSFMNFYPSPGLVKRMYNLGPTPKTGFFSMFGMAGYGVRSPVYKLATVRAGGEKSDKL